MSYNSVGCVLRTISIHKTRRAAVNSVSQHRLAQGRLKSIWPWSRDKWQFWDEVLVRSCEAPINQTHFGSYLFYDLIDESTLERTHMRMRKHRTVRGNISICVTTTMTTTNLTHSPCVWLIPSGHNFPFFGVFCVNNHEWNVSETETHA